MQEQTRKSQTVARISDESWNTRRKGDLMTDDVYQAHRAKVLGDVEYPDGHHIAEMKKYVTTSVKESDRKSLRGSSFEGLRFACNHIHAHNSIQKSKVYQGLRHLGTSWCYHELQRDDGDVFSDIKWLLATGALSKDTDVQRMADQGFNLFTDMKSKVYRVDSKSHGWVSRTAEESGLTDGDMSLYHALTGLKLICKYDSYYILMRDDPTFSKPLEVLQTADKSLEHRRKLLGTMVD